MKQLKYALLLLLLAGFVLATATGLFAGTADGRADYKNWSNRSARVVEPVGYNINGTSVCQACQISRQMNMIGNMGIGNGSASLMKPDVINAMTTDNATAAGGNETAPAGNATADHVIAAPASNLPGNGTLVGREIDTGPVVPAAAAAGPSVETLLPNYDLAASIIPRGQPYTITIGTPFPHILAEDPVEASVLYGKLLGFRMPDGQAVDVGIKCIGYEY